VQGLTGTKFKYWACVCSSTYVHMHVWVWALFYLTAVISHCLLAWLYYTYAYTLAKLFVGWWWVCGSCACRNVHFVWCKCRIQLMQEVLCIFRQQFTNMWKVFDQQIAFLIVIECAWDILHPCKASAVCKLYSTDCEARLHFMDLYLYGVHDRETDSIVILFIGCPLFQLGGCMNSQN
jgi:hypothetical protein